MGAEVEMYTSANDVPGRNFNLSFFIKAGAIPEMRAEYSVHALGQEILLAA